MALNRIKESININNLMEAKRSFLSNLPLPGMAEAGLIRHYLSTYAQLKDVAGNALYAYSLHTQ